MDKKLVLTLKYLKSQIFFQKCMGVTEKIMLRARIIPWWEKQHHIESVNGKGALVKKDKVAFSLLFSLSSFFNKVVTVALVSVLKVCDVCTDVGQIKLVYDNF